MVRPETRPRLTRLEDVHLVVSELRKLGIAGSQIYQRVTEVGPVDLDLLNVVLETERMTRALDSAHARTAAALASDDKHPEMRISGIAA